MPHIVSDAETLLLAQKRQAILLVDDRYFQALQECAVIELGKRKHKLKDLDAARIIELARQIVSSWEN